jgi:hypothetical protein
MVIDLRFAAAQAADGGHSTTDLQVDRGNVSNQPKRRPSMFTTRRQPAQPAKTGLFRIKRQPEPPTKTGLFRTKRQPVPPAKTGLMSKVKTLFSSRKEMTKSTPKARKSGRRK